MDVVDCGLLDRLDRDRLHLASVTGQLVVRKVVDEETADRADDGTRRLEPEREDADEVVASGVQLRLCDRCLANATQF